MNVDITSVKSNIETVHHDDPLQETNCMIDLKWLPFAAPPAWMS